MLVANWLVVCSSPSYTYHVADRSCRLCSCCTNVRLRRPIFSFVSMLKQNYGCDTTAIMLTSTNPAILTQTFKTDLNRLRHNQVKIIFVVKKTKKMHGTRPNCIIALRSHRNRKHSIFTSQAFQRRYDQTCTVLIFLYSRERSSTLHSCITFSLCCKRVSK